MTPEIQKVLRNLKTQRSPVVLDLCLRKTWSGKSHNYRRAIVLEKHRFQNVLRPNEFENPAFSNSSGLKSVFAKVWTVDLRNRRNKAAFSNFSGVVWRLPQKVLQYVKLIVTVLIFKHLRSVFPPRSSVLEKSSVWHSRNKPKTVDLSRLKTQRSDQSLSCSRLFHGVKFEKFANTIVNVWNHA